jgi:hypothetical protein
MRGGLAGRWRQREGGKMINFQDWLDRVARTFFDDDFPAYADAVEQPFVLVTATRTLIADTPDALRAGFEQFRDMLRDQGATDMIRLAQNVLPVGSTLLTGTYETHILRGGTRLFEPFASVMTLRLSGTTWRAACITNAMTNERWPIHLPRIDRGPPADP